MRLAPHSRFSVAMRRMSATVSADSRGFARALRRERQSPDEPEHVAMPAEQGLRFHEHQGTPPVGHHRGDSHQDQAIPDSEARPPDVSRGDEELLAKEGVLGKKLHPGTREICEEATTHATGLARCGCERRSDIPPTGTAKAAEELTHFLTELQEHGPSKALSPTPMEA